MAFVDPETRKMAYAQVAQYCIYADSEGTLPLVLDEVYRSYSRFQRNNIPDGLFLTHAMFKEAFVYWQVGNGMAFVDPERRRLAYAQVAQYCIYADSQDSLPSVLEEVYRSYSRFQRTNIPGGLVLTQAMFEEAFVYWQVGNGMSRTTRSKKSEMQQHFEDTFRYFFRLDN